MEKKVVDIIQQKVPVQCLNLYLWGSRFLGTHHEGSDWDFVAIFDGFSVEFFGENLIQEENIDIMCIDINEWIEMLNDHVPWAVQFLFWPEDGILFENFRYSLDFQFLKWRTSVLVNKRVNVRQAKVYYRNGSVDTAMKRILHSIRLLYNCTQIAKTFVDGSVVNFRSSNDLINEISLNCVNSYEEFLDSFSAIEADLVEQFLQVVSMYYNYEEGEGVNYKILRFINEYGIEKLWTIAGISVSSHPVYPDLCLLSRENTSQDFECTPVILEKTTHRIIGHSYKLLKSPDYSRFDFNTTDFIVTEKIDGFLILLYHHEGEWIISSRYSPSSEDILPNSNRVLANCFWELWKYLDYSFPEEIQCCFLFQIILKDDWRIIKYDEDMIYFHGVFDMIKREQLDSFLFAQNYSWKHVPTIIERSLEAITEKSLTKECNFIIKESLGNMVQVSHPIFHFFDHYQEPSTPFQLEILILELMPLFYGHPYLERHQDPDLQFLIKRVSTAWEEHCLNITGAYLETEDWENIVISKSKLPNIKKYRHYIFLMRKSNLVTSFTLFRNQATNKNLNKTIIRWWKQIYSNENPLDIPNYKNAIPFK